MGEVVLETARLRLRVPTLADFDAIHALTLNDRVRTFLGSQPPSVEDSFARFLRGLGCWHLFGWGQFVAETKSAATFVGSLGLFRAMRGLGDDFDLDPETGWVLHEDHWGQGYATEAMSAVLGWLDAVHGPCRTVCIISPGNTASERVAAKLGYRPIGMATYKDEPIMRYARAP
jgi:RimJ/RimL family protein N-acetyltransferase